MASRTMVLPLAIVSKVDLGRTTRELKNLDEFLTQAKVRSPGTAMTLPRLSRLLEEVAAANGINLLEPTARASLATALESLKTAAPKIHISFAADPSAAFIQKLIDWLRREIHPYLLLQIGLQPSIAAGCILRTPNKIFDFSLRRHLLGDRQILVELIKGKQNDSRQ